MKNVGLKPRTYDLLDHYRGTLARFNRATFDDAVMELLKVTGNDVKPTKHK